MELFQGFLALLALFTVEAALREAKDEEFPFQVSIQDLDKRHLCGGAIITPTWVLSTKACLAGIRSVRVAYGSADSNSPQNAIKGHNIVLQNELSLLRKDSLALIELEKPIEFSKTVKPAGLPTGKVELRNNTKLSGWKVSREVNLPPSLYVSDVYHVIPKDCKTETGRPVELDKDEFCGMDEDNSPGLFDSGSIVSKSAVVLGMLRLPPQSLYQPFVYVTLSEHEQWIREALGADAQHVNWVDKVPKDSAASHFVSITLIGISAIFLRFI